VLGKVARLSVLNVTIMLSKRAPKLFFWCAASLKDTSHAVMLMTWCLAMGTPR
jgi:hypothetical protein